MTNQPHKHHHHPAFYLRQWAGPDGQLYEFARRNDGNVRPRRTSPDGTGYVHRLYSARGLPEDRAHLVESGFMQATDTVASRALDKIARGDRTPWDTKERSDWTRFVLSLLFRTPENVSLLKGKMGDVWDTEVERIRGNYDAFRAPTDPATADEFFSLVDPGARDMAGLNLIQHVIDSTPVGTTINRMTWTRHVLKGARHTLLTSDRAILMPHGLGHRDAHIVLPIGPSMLFSAAHDDRMAQAIRGHDPTEVVRRVNLAVVRQARRYVWGADDAQLRFVQNHMSADPDRVWLTDAQGAAAVEATAAQEGARR